jgi:hypothetical protein
MDERLKKSLVGVVAAVAVAVAAYVGYNSLTSGERIQPGVNNDLPPGSKTGKQMEMEAMRGGRAAEERDTSQ